ncbi:MAG: sugar phosphate isomerase/epimerase [Sedimentisphaerales bacterium]|nr:sugar phosphate isomerase/epimerase [Sedimentisphaerales bacterium]
MNSAAKIGLAHVKISLLILVLLFLSSCLESGEEVSDDQKFKPAIGVCTSIDNYAKLKANNYDYTEESVGKFLIPHENEEEFQKNYAKLKDCGMEVYACNGFLPGLLKSTGPDIKHDQILAYSEIAFRRAQMAGIKVIVFGSSGSRNVPDGFDKQKARSQFVALLKKMGPIAEKYDITVCVEPLNKNESNIINSVAEGLDVVKQADHPNIQLLADVYHMAVEDEPAENIIKAGKHIRHVHVAEKEGRASPGTKKFDFIPYFKALKKINYKGRISIECRWGSFDNELPVALGYLNEQIQKLN